MRLRSAGRRPRTASRRSPPNGRRWAKTPRRDSWVLASHSVDGKILIAREALVIGLKANLFAPTSGDRRAGVYFNRSTRQVGAFQLPRWAQTKLCRTVGDAAERATRRPMTSR